MSELEIHWELMKFSDSRDSGAWFGHGLCIYAGQPDAPQHARLAAFVVGFEWLRGASEAVVRFDPRRVPRKDDELAAFKSAVEERVRRGDLGISEVVPGYFRRPNA